MKGLCISDRYTIQVTNAPSTVSPSAMNHSGTHTGTNSDKDRYPDKTVSFRNSALSDRRDSPLAVEVKAKLTRRAKNRRLFAKCDFQS